MHYCTYLPFHSSLNGLEITVHNYELHMSNHWCNRRWCRSRLLFPCMAYCWNSMSSNCHILKMITCNQTYALSFYKSHNIFCARPKIDLRIVPVTNLLCQTKRWFTFSKVVGLLTYFHGNEGKKSTTRIKELKKMLQ